MPRSHCDQTQGVNVSGIRDVFRAAAMTHVPLSGPEIAGVLNLRGRIVTAIVARSRLGQPSSAKSRTCQRLAIGLGRCGESVGLIIDEIGEVVRVQESDLEQNPVNLDATWLGVSCAVHRLEGCLLVIMDMDRRLAGAGAEDAAAAA
ncbi:MAG: chemotaxis protein CheW [Hyphomonadaceae bacterium]